MSRFTFRIVLVAFLATGCGTPPDLFERGADLPISTNSPTSDAPYPPGFTPRVPTPTVTPSPTLSPFPLTTSVPCAGRPTTEQVIALVRRDTDIEPVAAVAAPVCSGTWQYTMLEVPGEEPLQVLSKGDPGALTLVAVGTDVCSVDVRRQAPTGILLASC